MPSAMYERRLSPGQCAMLRTIADGKVKPGIESFEIMSKTTLRPLLKRGMVEAKHNRAVVTQHGYDAMNYYFSGDMPTCKAARRLSESVALMLHISNYKNRQMAKGMGRRRNGGSVTQMRKAS